jgi:diaminohydroxyphosphoribosylaminopyrimidine deaminase/5-amino-6-(5-phosphoribosylamino)uracil reductase
MRHMREALRLASKARGRTSPNPLVGAVLVKKGEVLACGYHRRAGGKHAEIIALEKGGQRSEGAELFLNLEPCAHTGRTPPCVEALIRARVGGVTIGMVDPNPLVSGKGIEALKNAGIPVRVGVLEEECRRLNAPFSKYITTGLPYVTLKLAATLDGKIATENGDSRWVTGEESRRMVHRLRNQVDAILVGIDTVLKDDPELTCRIAGGRNPARVVLDSRLRIPLTSKVLKEDGARVIVVTKNDADPSAAEKLRTLGVELIQVSERKGRPALEEALRELARAEMVHVMIEGGAETAASALRAQLVDRLLVFYAPKIVGAEGKSMIGPLGVRLMKDALCLKESHWRTLGKDLVMEGVLDVYRPD